ncbi:MAG: PEP-CTERM sorting domain-containing protein [Verrucomicrobia bacterium]|nr:PEP-CTERM sorting domain-containing protein [Verrucomicrobiota bacterium]
MKKLSSIFALSFCLAAVAPAAVVNFTGGTAYGNMTVFDPVTFTPTSVTSGVTDGTKTFRGVDYYLENGFKFDYVGGSGGSIGNYYGGSNDVIHGHWGTGEMTSIEITKVGGGTFDFNYFVLTSDTDHPGGAASGNEVVYAQAWLNGSQQGSNVQLPSEDWGLATTKDVFFDSFFDVVDKVVITSPMTQFSCFGMDAFYIDQAAPVSPSVPEPSALSLLALGLGGLVSVRGFRRS